MSNNAQPPIRFKRMSVEVKRVSDEGIFEFVGSTATPDRVGDVVVQAWDLEGYLRNPVVLYAHDHDGLPIAKTLRLWVASDGLHFIAQFVPAELYPFAGIVRSLYEQKFLNAFSVGFRSIGEQSPSGANYGTIISKSELLEVSAVPVPMNAEALLVERGAGETKIVPLYGKRDPTRTRALVMKGLRADEAAAWLEAETKAEPEAKPDVVDVEARLKSLLDAIITLRADVDALRAKAEAATAATVTETTTEPAQPVSTAADNEDAEDAEDEASYALAVSELEAQLRAELRRLQDGENNE